MTADPDLERGYRVLAAARPGDPMARASRTALALLTPGCFAAGQARRAVELLRAEGFRPAYAQLVAFDRERITRMWSDSLPPMEPDRRVVVYELLEAGESLLLLLAYEPGGGGRHRSASDRLADLKGHSDPERCEAWSLRTRLGAANRVINLLHTAKSTVDVVRELAILLGDDDLLSAWRAVPAPHREPFDEHLLDIGTRWCGNSLTHIAVMLRARLVAAVVAETGDWPALEGQVRCELAWLADRPVTEPRTVAADYRRTFPSRLPGYWAAAVTGGSPTCRARLYALSLLDDLQHGRPVDVEDLRRSLHRAACAVERWEWVVLASTAATSAPAVPNEPAADAAMAGPWSHRRG